MCLDFSILGLIIWLKLLFQIATLLDCTSTASLKKILASLLSRDFMVLTAGQLIMNPFFDVFFSTESFSRTFTTVLTISFPWKQRGKLQEEASPKTGSRRRWDNLVKSIQGRALPNHRGTGQSGRQSHPPKKDSVAVREI